ncbi:hypothetical protein F4677DRAFT_78313 [Hypoxylon crocopeplum]|nr:hypothetical protein F4677DRAFT_78313 [Hypoxylon crocopeplum]
MGTYFPCSNSHGCWRSCRITRPQLCGFNFCAGYKYENGTLPAPWLEAVWSIMPWLPLTSLRFASAFLPWLHHINIIMLPGRRLNKVRRWICKDLLRQRASGNDTPSPGHPPMPPSMQNASLTHADALLQQALLLLATSGCNAIASGFARGPPRRHASCSAMPCYAMCNRGLEKPYTHALGIVPVIASPRQSASPGPRRIIRAKERAAYARHEGENLRAARAAGEAGEAGRGEARLVGKMRHSKARPVEHIHTVVRHTPTPAHSQTHTSTPTDTDID